MGRIRFLMVRFLSDWVRAKLLFTATHSWHKLALARRVPWIGSDCKFLLIKGYELGNSDDREKCLLKATLGFPHFETLPNGGSSGFSC